MKKVLIQNDIFDKKNLDHDYNIIEQGRDTILKYSDNSAWVSSIRDTIAAKMEDTGDELIIKIDGLKKIKLDYSQAQQLFILLKINKGNWKIKIKEVEN